MRRNYFGPNRGRFAWAAAAGLAMMVVATVAEAQYGVRGRDDGLGGGRRSANKEDLEQWVLRLQDPNPSVRFAAVKWLGESGDPKAIRHLLSASGDPDPRIATRAVDFLGRLKAMEAADLLVERLFVKGTSNPLRQQILVALGRIGDSKTCRPILDFVAQAPDPELRSAALFALGEIGDATLSEEMTRLVERETDPRVQEVARDALDKISGRRFEPTPLPPGSGNPLLRPVEP